MGAENSVSPADRPFGEGLQSFGTPRAEHSTETLDYIVVIFGELTLLYGDREIALGPGDSVVQQGTPHGWANRKDESCMVAAVLLDAKR